MKLLAEHFDGFTEHGVSWTLEASSDIAAINASWFQPGGRVERSFVLDFPDTQIERIAIAIDDLKPEYNGHVDDFPTYSLCVIDGDNARKTTVHAGISWPADVQSDIDAFMSVWRPIYRDVERLLALPGRK